MCVVQVDSVKASTLSRREGSALRWEQQSTVCGCLKTAPTATPQNCYKTRLTSTSPLCFNTRLRLKSVRYVGFVWIGTTPMTLSPSSMPYNSAVFGWIEAWMFCGWRGAKEGTYCWNSPAGRTCRWDALVQAWPLSDRPCLKCSSERPQPPHDAHPEVWCYSPAKAEARARVLHRLVSEAWLRMFATVHWKVWEGSDCREEAGWPRTRRRLSILLLSVVRSQKEGREGGEAGKARCVFLCRLYFITSRKLQQLVNTGQRKTVQWPQNIFGADHF